MQNHRKYRLEEQAIELVQNFIKSNFKESPSCEEILKILGLKTVEDSLSFNQDGYLLGKQIVLNSNITYKPRRLFTIFHEITHQLILEDGEILEYLNDFYKGKDQDIKFKTRLEYLCNLGASEFLIPTEKLQEDIKKNGFSLSSFKKLKTAFEASAPAFLIKFAYLAPVNCVCLSTAKGKIKYGNLNQSPLFNSEKNNIEILFIEYWAKSKNFQYSLRRFSQIPEDHCISYCFESKTEISEDSYFPFFSGKKMPCFVEAFYEKGRVYGILYQEKPISLENQPTLGL